jgi:hypothetical protein
MASNATSFERTDRALADTFNGNLVDPINEMVTEFNALSTTVTALNASQNTLTDDTTATKYELGINNGLIYYREVTA